MSKPSPDMQPCTPHPGARQCGAMTLLFSLLLLVGAGILAFSAGRTSVVEQRIANNEYQAIEAQQAAQAGLEYALAWLASNTWSKGATVPTPPQTLASSGQAYDLSLKFNKIGNAVCVRSASQAVGETRLTAVAQECFLPAATGAARVPGTWRDW